MVAIRKPEDPNERRTTGPEAAQGAERKLSTHLVLIGDGVESSLSRPGRRDALPEHTAYADTGCDLHPSCLTCPLARCRYDEPGGARRLLSEERDRGILALQGEGRAVSAIAQRFGVSRRTVFRVLARGREAHLTPRAPLRTTERADFDESA